jgi:hypothetical protein
MDHPSGIVYYDPDTSNGRRTVHLPLEEVKVKVLIIDGGFASGTQKSFI